MDAQIRKVLKTATAFRSAELTYRHRLLSNRLNGREARKDRAIPRLRKGAERARSQLFAALAELANSQTKPAPLVSLEFSPPDGKSAAVGN